MKMLGALRQEKMNPSDRGGDCLDHKTPSIEREITTKLTPQDRFIISDRRVPRVLEGLSEKYIDLKPGFSLFRGDGFPQFPCQLREILTVRVWKQVRECNLFGDDSLPLNLPEAAQAPVSVDEMDQFILALEEKDVQVTKTNIGSLSLLCAEFGFWCV
jgi:hypothetical protein